MYFDAVVFSRSQDFFFTYIQIGSGHTVLRVTNWLEIQFNIAMFSYNARNLTVGS